MEKIGIWCLDREGELIRVNVDETAIGEGKTGTASVRTRIDRQRIYLWKQIQKRVYGQGPDCHR